MAKGYEVNINVPYSKLKSVKADPWSRIFGSIIDGIIGGAAALIIIGSMTGFEGEQILERAESLIFISALTGIFFSLIIPIITKGQTLGKMAVGTRMINLQGAPLGPGGIFGRNMVYFIPNLISAVPVIGGIIDLIIFIVIVISTYQLFNDPYGRTVQDNIANTMVANDRALLNIRRRILKERKERARLQKENADVEALTENDEIELTPIY